MSPQGTCWIKGLSPLYLNLSRAGSCCPNVGSVGEKNKKIQEGSNVNKPSLKILPTPSSSDQKYR